MGTRKPISKKLRFDVFKRDAFTCQYCGQTPPKVTLEPDHIDPVANGGTNDIDNLLTACFDCNRGKAAGLLTTVPATVAQKAVVAKERMEQLAAYDVLLKEKKARENKQIDEVEVIFRDTFLKMEFTPGFRESVRRFLQDLTSDDVLGAMLLACDRRPTASDATAYFCGICWNKIKGRKPRSWR